MTNSSDEISVMPTNKENVIYWYGLKSDNIQSCTAKNGWFYANGVADVAPIYQQNRIIIDSYGNYWSGVSVNNAINVKTLNALVQGNRFSVYNYAGFANLTSDKKFSKHFSERINVMDSVYKRISSTTTSGNPENCYPIIWGSSGTLILYALWYE